MSISIPLPAWVQTIRVDDVESATLRLTELLIDAQQPGQVGRGELESAASQVIEEAAERGVRLLGLVRPPGAPAALLSVAALYLETPFDQATATQLASYLADRGGPGVTDLKSVQVEGLGQVVLLHRTDATGAQAQAVVAEPAGEHWYLITLAAREADRGPELQRLLTELVTAGAPAR